MLVQRDRVCLEIFKWYAFVPQERQTVHLDCLQFTNVLEVSPVDTSISAKTHTRDAITGFRRTLEDD